MTSGVCPLPPQDDHKLSLDELGRKYQVDLSRVRCPPVPPRRPHVSPSRVSPRGATMSLHGATTLSPIVPVSPYATTLSPCDASTSLRGATTLSPCAPHVPMSPQCHIPNPICVPVCLHILTVPHPHLSPCPHVPTVPRPHPHISPRVPMCPHVPVVPPPHPCVSPRVPTCPPIPTCSHVPTCPHVSPHPHV